jgi:hypothetical protein
MLILGQGTPVKTNEGLRWLECAANQDDTCAIRLLFDLYSHGYCGVAVRASEAERWRQAAYKVEPGLLFLTFIGIENNVSAAATSTEALERLIDAVRRAVEESKVGDFSGPFWINNDYSIRIKGPDPDASLKAVEPVLNLFPALRDRCRVTKRYGPYIEGVREENIDLKA